MYFMYERSRIVVRSFVIRWKTGLPEKVRAELEIAQIGAWNVRTMYETDNSNQVEAERERHALDAI